MMINVVWGRNKFLLDGNNFKKPGVLWPQAGAFLV